MTWAFDSSWTYIVRNFQTLISRLSSPPRRCLKMTGPGEDILTPIAIASSSGEITSRIAAATTLSSTHFSKPFAPESGSPVTLITGSPPISATEWLSSLNPKISGTKQTSTFSGDRSWTSSRTRGSARSGSAIQTCSIPSFFTSSLSAPSPPRTGTLSTCWPISAALSS